MASGCWESEEIAANGAILALWVAVALVFGGRLVYLAVITIKAHAS
jgi:hypothetical protein